MADETTHFGSGVKTPVLEVFHANRTFWMRLGPHILDAVPYQQHEGWSYALGLYNALVLVQTGLYNALVQTKIGSGTSVIPVHGSNKTDTHI